MSVTKPVPATEIERIVGANRHPVAHIGRAVSAEQVFYILHSRQCLESGIDLRECQFSQALDSGIDMPSWVGYEDMAVQLTIRGGCLVPWGPPGVSP